MEYLGIVSLLLALKEPELFLDPELTLGLPHFSLRLAPGLYLIPTTHLSLRNSLLLEPLVVGGQNTFSQGSHFLCSSTGNNPFEVFQ